MPSLVLRPIGVSHVIEGVGGSGLDGEALFEALQSRHGVGAAAMGVPVETILVDQKAESREGLMAWLEAWAQAEGFSAVSWSSEGPPEAGIVKAHFES